jgi:hypothetical protein
VVYRKGELSKGTIDRDWPHQVALSAERCLGGNYVTFFQRCLHDDAAHDLTPIQQRELDPLRACEGRVCYGSGQRHS